MNTGPDLPGVPGRDPDAALTPEERALAERIARSSLQREPAPELDARILAAARAAVSAPAAVEPPTHAPIRMRRRWPVALGAAATLVLAVGLAWQLRPIDDTRVEYSEAPRASRMTAVPGPGGPQAVDDASQAEDAAPARESVPSSPKIAPAAAAETPASIEAPAAAADQEPEAKPAPMEAPVVFDEPSPMDTPAPAPSSFPAPPPAPPPPAVPAQGVTQASAPVAGAAAETMAAEDKVRTRRAQSQTVDSALKGGAKTATASGNVAVEPERAKVANEADAAEAGALDRIDVSGTRIERFGDQPLDDQPPASADSPPVQQAWLQRVRQLVAENRLDAARDSLREYQRRYPRATLPDDLRALLGE